MRGGIWIPIDIVEFVDQYSFLDRIKPNKLKVHSPRAYLRTIKEHLEVNGLDSTTAIHDPTLPLPVVVADTPITGGGGGGDDDEKKNRVACDSSRRKI